MRFLIEIPTGWHRSRDTDGRGLMRFDLSSPEAQSLRNSLAVGREAVEEARVGYQDAIEAFVDTNWSNDGVFALGRDGIAYAQAVMQYSSAVMARLVFVDKQLHILDNKC